MGNLRLETPPIEQFLVGRFYTHRIERVVMAVVGRVDSIEHGEWTLVSEDIDGVLSNVDVSPGSVTEWAEISKEGFLYERSLREKIKSKVRNMNMEEQLAKYGMTEASLDGMSRVVGSDNKAAVAVLDDLIIKMGKQDVPSEETLQALCRVNYFLGITSV